MGIEVKVGSRVKVEYKSYNGEVIIFKGEVVSDDVGKSFKLLGFSASNPSVISETELNYSSVISIDNTRLHKTLSTALTEYVKLYKEELKLRKEIQILQGKASIIRDKRNNINHTIPEQLAKTSKNLTPDILIKLVGKEIETLGIASDLDFRYTKGNKIILTLDVSCRDYESKYLGVYREYDGQAFMSDYTQTDVINHLKNSRYVKLKGYLDVSGLSKYFTVVQEFSADANSHNDMTIDISLYVYLTLKKSVTKDDLKDIGKLLKDLSYTFKTYRDRR